MYGFNDHLIKVIGRNGEETAYEYDAMSRPVAEHRPNGISTYKTYNARNQITEMDNQCDDCSTMTVRTYSYNLMGNLAEKVQYKAGNFTEISKMDAICREDFKIQPSATARSPERCSILMMQTAAGSIS